MPDEPRTQVDSGLIDAEEWTWRKVYRIWEANRKVFLHPENWIEPELRLDKSPFFRELESELLQSEFTDERVERALPHYLLKLDEVARLEVAGFVREPRPGDDDLLRVFGRTANPPRTSSIGGSSAAGSRCHRSSVWRRTRRPSRRPGSIARKSGNFSETSPRESWPRSTSRSPPRTSGSRSPSRSSRTSSSRSTTRGRSTCSSASSSPIVSSTRPEISDPVFSRDIVILSGHGCLAERHDIQNSITIPSRFTVTLWTWTKGTGVSATMMLLDDAIGNMVDSGQFTPAYQKVNTDLAVNGRRLPITYDEGDEIPNLMILPPRRNQTGTAAPNHRLHTVDRPGSLEDFLANLQRENRPVNLHWSACSEIVTRRAQFGQITEGNVQNLFEVAKTYLLAEGVKSLAQTHRRGRFPDTRTSRRRSPRR